MVCRCSLRPTDSFVPSLKACTSSGRRRPVAKVWAILPPSPFSYIRIQAVEGKGLPSSKNLGFHAGVAWEEDTIPGSTWVCGSWIIIHLVGRGGVRVTASPEPVGGWSETFCLFQTHPTWGRGRGGGACTWLWEGGGYAACRAPGTKRSMVMVFRVTISSQGKELVAGKLITNCSASTVGALSSTGSSRWVGSWTGTSWMALWANS